MIEVTLPVWIGLLTHAPAQVAGVAAAELLAGFAAGPLAGVLADRRPPRRTMLVCDVLRLLVLLALVVAPPRTTVPCIYGAGFVVACLTRFFNPARSVLLTAIVAADAIPRAQALTQATQSLALIAGPALGALLLLGGGPRLGIALDATSFGLSALTLLFVRAPAPPPPGPRQSARDALRSLGRDLAGGLGIVQRHRGLCALLAASIALSLVGNLWFAVDLFFVQRSLHAPADQVGFLWTAAGIGGLLGSAGLAAAGARYSPRLVLLCGLGLRGLAILWYAGTTRYAAALPAAGAAGLAEALALVTMGSLTLRWAPAQAVGRVSALLESAGQVGALVALVVIARLQDVLAPAQILTSCGAALVVATGATWLLLRERHGDA